MSGKVIEVSDATFRKEVLESDMPVLVDFWAEWCGPCKVLAPTVEEIANEYDGRLKVAKLNVDHNINTAAQYNIRSIPTLLLFKGGIIRDQIVGVVPKHQIVKVIEQNLQQ